MTSTSRAGLSPVELRAGLAIVAANRVGFADRFFETLFSRYPDLRELFPDDHAWTGATMMSMIDAVVGTADDTEALVDVIHRLGVDNRTIGLRDRHYALIGHALVLTARSVGGTAWTPEIDRAWVDGFDVVAELMVSSTAREHVRGAPWIQGHVVEHVRVTPDAAVLLVRLDEAILVRPGQHMMLSSPSLPGVWRPYHVVPVPSDAHAFELHVRWSRQDGVAAALVRAEPGDELRLGRPQGMDLLRRIDDANILAVTVGTGIAPVLALVADPAVAAGGRRVHVFYGGRTAEDLAALDRLEMIGRRFPRLDVVAVVTTSGTESDLARSMADIAGSYADWRRNRIITAGPTATLRPTLDRLRALGVAESSIIRADRRALSSTL